MKITVEHCGITVNANLPEDTSADEATEVFTSLLVALSFPPSVIKIADGGHYECKYKGDK